MDVFTNNSFSFRGQGNDMTIAKLQVQPFQGGFEDFDSGESFLVGTSLEYSSERRSLLEDLLFYWRKREPEGFDMNKPTLVSLSYYPLRIIAAEWLMYSGVMFHSNKQHEYAPNFIPVALKHVALLNNDLLCLQAWARRSTATLYKLHDVIGFFQYQRTQDRDVDCCTLLIEDYEDIASFIDTYNRRLKFMIPAIISLIQILDSQ